MDKQIVHIVWVDSSMQSGWRHGEVDNELSAIHSIGFIAKMDKKAITITSTVGNKGLSYLDLLTIPFGAILKVTKIKLNSKQIADR